eukprot:Nk52_evm28s1444 gene=Nk52_evmTU28s1444
MGVLKGMFGKSKQELNLSVRFDDGTIENARVQSNVTAEGLIEHLLRGKEIHESEFFGLSFVDIRGLEVFVKNHAKIVDEKIPVVGETASVSLCARYFPATVDEIVEDSTRELFYHACKKKVYSGAWILTFQDLITLTAYEMMISKGPFDEEVFGDSPDHLEGVDIASYWPEHFQFTDSFGKDEFALEVILAYKENSGKSKLDVIEDYIILCTSFPNYGVYFYRIKNKNETDLFLGINSKGFHVYSCTDKNDQKASFFWDELDVINYSGKKFIIQFSEKGAKHFNAICYSVTEVKQVFYTCIGYHSLYKRLTDPNSEDLFRKKLVDEKKRLRLLRIETETQKTNEIEQIQDNLLELAINKVAQEKDLKAKEEELRLLKLEQLRRESASPRNENSEKGEFGTSPLHNQQENVSCEANMSYEKSPSGKVPLVEVQSNGCSPMKESPSPSKQKGPRVRWRRNRDLCGELVNTRIDFFESM